jgi:DNA mismatch repair protein MutS
VRAARRHLAELETQLRPGGAQPDLFSSPDIATGDAAASDAASPLREALDDLDPDTLSPREALEAINRLKKLSDR